MEHPQDIEVIAANQVEDHVGESIDAKRPHVRQVKLEGKPERPEFVVQFQLASRAFELVDAYAL